MADREESLIAGIAAIGVHSTLRPSNSLHATVASATISGMNRTAALALVSAVLICGVSACGVRDVASTAAPSAASPAVPAAPSAQPSASPSAVVSATPPAQASAPESASSVELTWPLALDEADAMGRQQLSVVWLSVAAEDSDIDAQLTPVTSSLSARGYEGAPVPMMCQANAVADLGLAVEGDPGYAFGVGVYFAARADAERFAALYDGPMLGIVDGDFFCDYD